jgi:hypothetical protein
MVNYFLEFTMIKRHIIEIDENTLSNISKKRLIKTRNKWENKTINKLTILNIRYVRDNRQPIAIARYRCECGNTGETALTLITKNNTTSCGCWNSLKQQKLPGEAACRACYSSRRADAKHRQLGWKLTIEEYKYLTSQNCYYCDKPPSNEYGSNNYNGNYKYSGLDRVNNLLGYQLDNCVPCCKECNHAKGMLSMQDFTNHIRQIYDNFVVNKGGRYRL